MSDTVCAPWDFRDGPERDAAMHAAAETLVSLIEVPLTPEFDAAAERRIANLLRQHDRSRVFAAQAAAELARDEAQEWTDLLALDPEHEGAEDRRVAAHSMRLLLLAKAMGYKPTTETRTT